VAPKRSTHERFPEVIAAAVRVFARDGYRSAHMSDVAREAGLSEAALYRYVDGKEDLFVLSIRHALLLEPLPEEDDPAGTFPLKAPPLAEMIRQAREFVAEAIPFGSLAEALVAPETDDPAAELESIMRELFALEATWRAALRPASSGPRRTRRRPRGWSWRR
jgi:AcrR family transcriptional regulator